MGFSLGNFGYVAGGVNGSGMSYNNVWRYNPSNNQWIAVASMPSSISEASTYSLCNRIYITCGYSNGNFSNNIISYEPVANTWRNESNFSGSSRRSHISMVLDGKPHIFFGYNGSYLNDFGVRTDPSNLPNTIFNADVMQVCSNQFPVNLSAPTVQSASYLWNTGVTSHNIQVSNAGQYWVTITDQCGFSKKDTITIINPNSINNLFDQQDFYLCENNPIELKPNYTFINYLWSTGETTSSIIITKAGSYWLKVNNGCKETIDTIQVFDNINEDYLKKIPNAFTPNNDTKNDFFEIPNELIGSKLDIYNRWGKRVFVSDSYKNNWNGDGLTQGVYYYVITTRKKCLKPIIKGWLTILK